SSGLMSYGNMFEKRIKFDVEIKPCPKHKYSCLHECIENSLETRSKITSVLKEDFIEKFLVMKNRIPFIK
ncbi:MAG: hypothetical protein PHI15_10395, partial [Methanomicrobium sp.]|nr:hypothetical protein [Methanomicrobium sp.]